MEIQLVGEDKVKKEEDKGKIDRKKFEAEVRSGEEIGRRKS